MGGVHGLGAKRQEKHEVYTYPRPPPAEQKNCISPALLSQELWEGGMAVVAPCAQPGVGTSLLNKLSPSFDKGVVGTKKGEQLPKVPQRISGRGG